MNLFVLKTKNRQGEYIKPEYNGKNAPDGWNHFAHTNRAKVEEYAQKNNIVGYIEKI